VGTADCSTVSEQEALDADRLDDAAKDEAEATSTDADQEALDADCNVSDADQNALDVDQSASDADQSASDADQNASNADYNALDADQSASDADQNTLYADQSASDADHNALDADQAGEADRAGEGDEGGAPSAGGTESRLGLISTKDAAPVTDVSDREKLAFLNVVGAGEVAHTGNGALDAHLTGVRRVLHAWGAGDDVCDAGLFHSIYGTEGFQGFCISFDRRDEVRALIGERAERLAYVFCVVDRLSVDNDLDSAPGAHGFTARPELGGFTIPMNDSMWIDFITLTLADWLEQVEGAAEGVNPLFQWESGDAWGYRRGAYARMADLVGVSIPDARALHAAVFSREPIGSRHLSQPVTPPMTEAARSARVGLPRVTPTYG